MRFFRELILENWGLKLLSVFLALVLWFFVRGDPGAERIITVPLEIRIPTAMEITSERPTSVDVTVRGNTTNSWFGQSVPTCIVNLENAGEGLHSITLGPQNVRIPGASGLEVIKINPPRISLSLEKTVSKEVTVLVATRGEPAAGFEVYGKLCNPSSVILTGPRSHVEKIQGMTTEIVSLAGQKQSLRSFANLEIHDNLLRTIPVGPIEVNIELGVQRRTVIIDRVPLEIDDDAYVAVPARVSVEVLVPETFKQDPAAGDIKVTVSLSGSAPPQLPAKVKPTASFAKPLDPAIIIKEVIPSEVTVRKRGS
jgi:YbbR domain-containing protein